MFDMVVSFVERDAVDLERMFRGSTAPRHGANVPIARRTLDNACELCPDRV
jgi:hypothetical protein